MSKFPYSEGSAFFVPLRRGGYGRGVVARAAPDGKVLLGYFFGPRMESNTTAALDDLHPAKTILRVRFGALGLLNGEWSIFGTVPRWNRSQWSTPDFVRRDPLARLKPRLVHYSDDDPSLRVAEHPIDDDSGLEPDALYGYGAVEIALTKLIDETS
jgi:Immunity protein 26